MNANDMTNEDKKNLDTLISLRDKLDSPQDIVEASRIHNPTQAIQGTLASFLTRRLNRIEEDANFVDIVREAIKTRLPEASMEQLILLVHELSDDNNKAAEGIASLFKNENSGKTVLDTVKSTSVENTAEKLYASTDSKEVLQAVSYLGSIMSKLVDNSTEGKAEVVE